MSSLLSNTPQQIARTQLGPGGKVGITSQSLKLRQKHPGLVPVVCYGPGEKAPGKLQTTKLLCPKTMTGEQFRKIVMEKAPMPVGIDASKVSLSVKKNASLVDSMTMDQIDHEYASTDGYVNITIEIRNSGGRLGSQEAKSPVATDDVAERNESNESSPSSVQSPDAGDDVSRQPSLSAQVFHLPDNDADDSCEEDGEENGADNFVGQRSSERPQRTFESRQSRSKKILAKYPDRIPVHVVQHASNGWPAFDKKFLTPKQMDGKEFKEVIRKQISGGVDRDVWSEVLLFAGKSMLSQRSSMQELYETHRSPDLLLYITFDTPENRLEDPFAQDASPYGGQSMSTAELERLRGVEKKLVMAEDRQSVQNAKIASLEATIQELQTQLTEKQEGCSSAMQKLHAVERDALAATDTCRIAELNLQQCQTRLQERESTLRDCHVQLLEKGNALMAMQIKYDEAEAERKRRESERAEIASKEVAELRQELEAENKRCSLLWERINHLQATNQSLQKDLDAERADHDAETIIVLQRKLREVGEEKDKTQEKLHSVEAQLAQKLDIEQEDGGFVKIEPEEEGLNFYKIG